VSKWTVEEAEVKHDGDCIRFVLKNDKHEHMDWTISGDKLVQFIEMGSGMYQLAKEMDSIARGRKELLNKIHNEMEKLENE
jgi:uncharacterized protein (DUF1800 family)